MDVVGTVKVEIEVKASPDKFWGAIYNPVEILPKAIPHHYKSIEIVEGDGKSVGSVRLINFEGISSLTFLKEKIEELDVENKTMSYSVIEREPANIYKSFKAKLEVTEKGEGSLVKWSCDYEMANEVVPNLDRNIESAKINNFKDIDAYLLRVDA